MFSQKVFYVLQRLYLYLSSFGILYSFVLFGIDKFVGKVSLSVLHFTSIMCIQSLTYIFCVAYIVSVIFQTLKNIYVKHLPY
jgi:hypothetical protein